MARMEGKGMDKSFCKFLLLYLKKFFYFLQELWKSLNYKWKIKVRCIVPIEYMHGILLLCIAHDKACIISYCHAFLSVYMQYFEYIHVCM